MAAGARIYFAGDTAYAPFFRDVRQRFGPIDVALLPIGAYEPRWFMQSVHMNPAEAVQAHLDLEASESIGMHFGTFQLTTEGIDEPLRALEEARRARSIPPSQFRTLPFGESLRLGQVATSP
jgi:L-ascorbate metabolism protein UlaG (beta-lactamase superfamily)